MDHQSTKAIGIPRGGECNTSFLTPIMYYIKLCIKCECVIINDGPLKLYIIWPILVIPKDIKEINLHDSWWTYNNFPKIHDIWLLKFTSFSYFLDIWLVKFTSFSYFFDPFGERNVTICPKYFFHDGVVVYGEYIKSSGRSQVTTFS